MKKEFNKLLSTMLAMCFIFFILAGVLPATPVYAAVGTEFSVSAGFEADGVTPVTIGADMKFKVTAEPSGATPGTVQVGDDDVASILTTTNVAVTIPTLVSDGTNTYTVTKLGSGAFYRCGSLPSITIPESITAIGYRAFVSCSSLTSINIPKNVASIGDGAFLFCSALNSLTVDLDNQAFTASDNVLFDKGITTLIIYLESKTDTTYTVPSTVTTIKDYAFRGVSNLTLINIPSSVETIGENVFQDCTNLESITVDTGNPNFSSDGGVLINNSITTLITYPAKKIDTTYTVPSTVTTIAAFAFQYAENLSSVVLPVSVASIGSSAFHSCTNLTTINLENVTTIGWFAFYKAALTSIDISNIKTIGNGAFEECNNLTSVAIPEGVTDIPYATFRGRNGRPLTSITFPSTLKTIGSAAFINASSVDSLTLPNGLITIGSSAFSQLDGLTSLVIPSSVTSIGAQAFGSCDGGYVTTIGDPPVIVGPGLSSVSILSSDITMEKAFFACTKLKAVYINGNYDAAKLDASISTIPSDSSPTIYYNAAMAGWPAQLTIDGSATAPAVPVEVTHGTTQFTYDGSPKTVDVTDVLVGGALPFGAYTVAGNTATAVGTHEFTVTIPVSGTDSIVYSGSYVISSPAPTPTPTPTNPAISPDTGVYN